MSFSTKNPVRQRSGTGWIDLFSGISFEGRAPLRRPQSGANRRLYIVNPPPEIYPTRWRAVISSSPRQGRFGCSHAGICLGRGRDAPGAVACMPTLYGLHPLFRASACVPSRWRGSCRGLNAFVPHAIQFSNGLIQRWPLVSITCSRFKHDLLLRVMSNPGPPRCSHLWVF
jgi:hypothetical protein